MRVAICALTYLRPAGLTRLLEGLERLDVPSDIEIEIFVVDNDPDRSAAPLIESYGERSSWELTYLHQPARGISAARNTAVTAALEWKADAVCFIDDDEWPDAGWLRELVATRAATCADVVTGPVFPVFDEKPPSWVTDGNFFDRPLHRHHEPIGYATTSSVLMTSACFAGRPEPFDTAFGLSGGEDTHLFAQLSESGHRIVWCDLAHVFESIPTSKIDEGWLLRREYRRGQTLSLSLRARDPRTVRAARRIGNASLQIVQGCARGLAGIPRGRAGWLTGIQQVVFGVGMLTGLLGRRYEEYRTTHGG